MRISGVAKKGLALVLTMAVAVGGVAISPSQASAAKKKAKAKSITVITLLAADCDADGCAWLYGEYDGSSSVKPSALKSQTIKLTKGKKTSVTISLPKPAKFNKKKVGKVKEAVVFTVDMKAILKSFKKVKVSNVVVKCDGKKVKCKPVIGSFEKNKPDSKDNWRISFYNKWGRNGDNSKDVNKASKFKFKKNITVTFNVTAK